MNFKLFTTALLATGATAAYSEDAQALGNAMQANYNGLAHHDQRRFWVSILGMSRPLDREKTTQVQKSGPVWPSMIIMTKNDWGEFIYFSMLLLQTLLMPPSTIFSVK